MLINRKLFVDVDELVNKLRNTSTKLINNKNDLSVKTSELSNELLETLKIIENCKDKKVDGSDEFHKLINVIKNYLVELEKGKEQQSMKKEDIIHELNKELFRTENKLSEILCEGCKEKEIEKLINKCGNGEIARFIYECKLNANKYYKYIQWIPFNEFRNIKYLAKGGFGEVHKATWINYYYNDYEELY